MDKKDIIIMLDNGHGSNTPGKRSPDGSVLEYAYTRRLAAAIHDVLTREGYRSVLITPEEADVSITTRVNRANKLMKQCREAVLISLHLDALGDGREWNNARGFSARVAISSSYRSKQMAKCLVEQARTMNLLGNRSVPWVGYWTQNLGICRDTRCPAVLTESAFMTNHDDVSMLLSDEGFLRLVELHVAAIKTYVKNL